MLPTPSEIIRHLLPHVATAGTYSSFIQNRVGEHSAKDGATSFHQALSDADLTIQSYLEVVMLARFPDLSFFSEEHEQSLNVKYFRPDADLEVLLDPIDGTRCYLDNRQHYQIIIAIHDNAALVGALLYQPRLDRCYIAVKGEGAYVLTHSEASLGARGTRLALSNTSGPVLMFNQPEMYAKLAPIFDARDIITEYATNPGRYNSTDILQGKALASISSPCQAIDGGAIAFIAKEAGATVTDFSGKEMGNFRESPKRIVPNILVSTCPQAHQQILSALQS
jgi:fructose-1,6-bisphosphatase/inositol monophosphatase family enzyme